MSAQAFLYDVFLSHSAKDKAVVRPLAERLRHDGLKVWFDEWVLKPGDSIPAKIEEGLEQSRVLVLCLSAQAFGSDWAQWEAGTCGRGNLPFRDPLNRGRRFIPLGPDDAPIKGSLAQFLYINWRRTDRSDTNSTTLPTNNEKKHALCVRRSACRAEGLRRRIFSVVIVIRAAAVIVRIRITPHNDRQGFFDSISHAFSPPFSSRFNCRGWMPDRAPSPCVRRLVPPSVVEFVERRLDCRLLVVGRSSCRASLVRDCGPVLRFSLDGSECGDLKEVVHDRRVFCYASFHSSGSESHRHRVVCVPKYGRLRK